MQDFDRDAATDALMDGFKNATHATVADFADDFVMSDELSYHGDLLLA